MSIDESEDLDDSEKMEEACEPLMLTGLGAEDKLSMESNRGEFQTISSMLLSWDFKPYLMANSSIGRAYLGTSGSSRMVLQCIHIEWKWTSSNE